MFRERIISLTGFMGSGKSSVGRELSALLSCPMVDLDSYIEVKESRTIPDIFATDGEAAFRALELTALQSLLCPGEEELRCGHWDTGRQRQISHSVCGFLQADNGIKNPPYMILSLGGGTLTTPQCADLIRSHTYCIYLRAGIDTLVRNLRNDTAGRPLLSPAATSASLPETQDSHILRNRIETLMSARSHIYESVSSLIIDIDGKSFSAISSEIADRLQRL